MALMLALTLVIGFLGTANAQADSDRQRPERPRRGIVSSQNDGVQVAAQRFWTAEEMMNVQEYPTPLLAEDVAQDLLSDDREARPTGRPGEVPAVLPQIDGAVESDLAETDAAIEALISPNATEPPSYSTFPYSAVGKVFFKQNGSSYVCSAAVIKNRSIWTAGHCVHAGDGRSSSWSTDVVFVPQYRNGSAPIGQWTVSQLWTTNGWYSNENFDVDYAGGQVNDLNGRAIGSRTGILGFKYNQSYSATYRAVGYPAGSPFDGQRMWYCNSGLKRTLSGNPSPFSIDCDMTGGSSGGPWIRDFRSGSNSGANYLNGNNSFGIPSLYPNEMFSPYLDSAAKRFYDGLPS
jgi:V8-like Glu-specific endopeptidase